MQPVSVIVVTALIALLVTVLFQGEDLVNPRNLKLGDPAYDIVPIQSPAADSWVLMVLTYILTRSPLGPSIRRILLKDNKINLLRDLAAQIKLPPLHFPMRRLDKDSRAKLEANSCEEGDELCIQKVITKGFEERDDNTLLKTSIDYHHAYLEGHTTPTKVARRILDTVERWEQQGLVIFSSILVDNVMHEAELSEARYAAKSPLSVLDGVPVAFKDMMCIAGHKYYNGRDAQRFTEAKQCTEDDEIVANFRRVGSIILGLTVMVEGGVTPLGYNTHWKGPHSVYSASRYSGGSSSGSAVAVASGLVPIAVGFDGGGSVRIPAAMSGVHGLAMSFGRAAFNPEHLSSTMIKAGPIAASAVDTALGYAVMAHTPALHPKHLYNRMYDGGYLGVPRHHLSGWDEIGQAEGKAVLAGVNIGVFAQWNEDVHVDLRSRTQEVADFLVGQGATLVPIRIPHLMVASFAHALKIATEFARAFDSDYALNTTASYLEDNTRVTVSIGMTPTALEQLCGDVLRHWLFEHVTQLFANHSLTAILTPTLGFEVPILRDVVKQSRGESNNRLSVQVMKFISLANFLGLPGYAIPVGGMAPSSTAAGEDAETLRLPVSIQLLGDHWRDHDLLRLGHLIEQQFTSKLKTENRAPPVPIFHVNPLQA